RILGGGRADRERRPSREPRADSCPFFLFSRSRIKLDGQPKEAHARVAQRGEPHDRAPSGGRRRLESRVRRAWPSYRIALSRFPPSRDLSLLPPSRSTSLQGWEPVAPYGLEGGNFAVEEGSVSDTGWIVGKRIRVKVKPQQRGSDPSRRGTCLQVRTLPISSEVGEVPSLPLEAFAERCVNCRRAGPFSTSSCFLHSGSADSLLAPL